MQTKEGKRYPGKHQQNYFPEIEILMPSENTGVRPYLTYCIIQERPPRVTLFDEKGSVIASTAPILALRLCLKYRVTVSESTHAAYLFLGEGGFLIAASLLLLDG